MASISLTWAKQSQIYAYPLTRVVVIFQSWIRIILSQSRIHYYKATRPDIPLTSGQNLSVIVRMLQRL